MQTKTKGFIKLGRQTAQHAQTLERLGYEVTHMGDRIVVDAEGFHTEPFEFTPAGIADLVRSKKLLTYGTPITFPDGKVLSGVFAVGRMGALSALMAKPLARVAASSSSTSVEEVLALLR